MKVQGGQAKFGRSKFESLPFTSKMAASMDHLH